MINLKILDNCYAVRNAAGQYWLLDISQPGIPYKRPLTMNEIGALIWSMLEKEYTLHQIVTALSEEYSVPEEVILDDVTQFIHQLKLYGVKVEE